MSGETDSGGAGETEATIQNYIETVKGEWNRRETDLAVIRDRVHRTASHRFHRYEGLVAALLETYRCLQEANQIIEDCALFCKVNAGSNRSQNLTNKLDFLLQKVLRSNKADQLQYVKPTMQSPRVVKVAYVLVNLPLLFNESLNKWIYIDKDVRGTNSGVSIYTPNEEEDILSETCELKVFLDGEVLCANAPNAVTVFDVLVSAVYLFHVQYLKKLVQNYRFLAKVICGFKCDRATTVPVQGLANQMAVCDNSDK